MSTRTGLRPQIVINAGDMSGNLISQPTVLQSLTMGSYGFQWAGTAPVGTISLQISDDYSLDPNGQVNNPGHWNTAPVSVGGTTMTAIPVSGNTGNGYLEILGTGGYAVRVIYTATSGTGSLTAEINGKVG